MCVSEYRANGKWMCGMNFITSIEDVLDTAEKEKLNIIFESVLRDKK